MTDLKIQGISKRFGGREVLRNVTAAFPAGSVTCLLGPSGFGKTTLLRIIAGLEKPDAGRIDGVPARIGFVFQEDRLFDKMSAAENVAIVRPETSAAVAAEELEKLMPADLVSIPVSELSPVHRRITAIVRAVSVPSDILIMDEPFRGMDDEITKKVFSYIKEVAGHKGIIIAQRDQGPLPPLRNLKLT